MYKLRVDWIGRIYTVVNLRAEDFGEADPTIREIRYREKAEPMYEYLTELNLHEVVSPTVEYVPNTYSYLVKFVPRFEWLKLGWFFGFIFKWGMIILVLYWLSTVINVEYFWNLLIKYLNDNKILR
jgi:hypothetical protein